MTAVRRTSKDRAGGALGYRGLFLFVLAVPFAVATFNALRSGQTMGMVFFGLGLALMLASAQATRKGLQAEKAYDDRPIAQPPSLPMKGFGGLAAAGAVGLTAWLATGLDIVAAAALAVAALVGHTLAYGLDPRKSKGEIAGHGFTPDEVAEAVDEALGKIDAIEKSARSIKVREFTARLNSICGIARSVVTNIEKDPGDLRRARRFLNIYLDSARQVTEKYAKTHKDLDDAELEHNFRDLLVNMENAFEEQRDRLLRNDKLDLDVEIEVLSDQLRREGII
ncbi:MAG: 5-bromo-4-chloroindolyl phosphate hydrolysis family protein [Pseudomonadota bacterium]